jgi:hypothetical protein
MAIEKFEKNNGTCQLMDAVDNTSFLGSLS